MFFVTPLWVEMLVPDEVWTAFCCLVKDQPRVRHWEEKSRYLYESVVQVPLGI